MCPIQVATSEQLEIRFRPWGGRRPHAGRKPSGRKVGVPHRARPLHERRYPVHVTFRAERLLPSLREERFVLALRRGLARASRSGFRILQFSIQTNHLHLMVSAAVTGQRGDVHLSHMLELVKEVISGKIH